MQPPSENVSDLVRVFALKNLFSLIVARLLEMIYDGIKNLDRSFFRFVAIHAFDRQTDRQTDEQTAFSSLDRVYIACSTVKTTLRLSDNVGYNKLERSFFHLYFLLTEKKR